MHNGIQSTETTIDKVPAHVASPYVSDEHSEPTADDDGGDDQDGHEQPAEAVPLEVHRGQAGPSMPRRASG